MVVKIWKSITSALIGNTNWVQIRMWTVTTKTETLISRIKNLKDKSLHNKTKWLVSVYSAKGQFKSRYIFRREVGPRMVLHHTKYVKRIGVDKSAGSEN